MREIIYRGISVDTNKWEYGNPIQYEVGIFIMYPINCGEWDLKHCLPYVKPYTIGQWTGETGADGIKLFEGDICKFQEGEESIKLFVIEWNKDYCGFVAVEYVDGKRMRVEYLLTPHWREFPKQLTVIGNIHDNPELWR